jgi:polar amino acid transport system substrate-binding protein
VRCRATRVPRAPRVGSIARINNRLSGVPTVKKIVLSLVASVLAAGLMTATAVGKSTGAPPTMTAGTLTVGLTPPAVGFQVGTLKGTSVVNPKGMEIELAKDIAKKLGLKKIVWYYQASFAKSYAPGPKPYDLYFGEETITPERSKNVDYSIPYIQADQGVMVRKGLSPLPKSIADLKKITVCAQAGTTGAAYIKAHVKPTKALYPSSLAIMFQQLVSKQCDATIFDVPILGAESGSKPGKYGPILARIVTHENYGIAFTKGSKLRAVVNPVLKGLIKDGTVGKLQKKWLSANFSELPVWKQ